MPNQRCNAWCHHHRKRCTQWCVPGRRRCRYHGGLSTGPYTAAGKARSTANLEPARERGRATGRASGGRRRGLAWKTEKYWAKRIADAFAVSPEEAAKVARELVEHHREKQTGLELIKRIEEIKRRPGFECEGIKEEIKGEIKYDE
jgi:hypothetical protein